MNLREAVDICRRREHLRKTVAIALVVGTILMIINHADVILRGDATAGTWIKAGLSYCVPFVVSNLGLLAAAGHSVTAKSLTPSTTTENPPRTGGGRP